MNYTKLVAAPRRPCPFGAPLHVEIWFAWQLRRIKHAPSGQAAQSALRADIRAAAPHQSCPLEACGTVAPAGQDKSACATLLMPFRASLFVENI